MYCEDGGRVTHRSTSMRLVRKRSKIQEMYSSKYIVRKNTHFCVMTKENVLNVAKGDAKSELKR